MSKAKRPRLPPDVRAELDACGLQWSIENGRKHFHLIVGGATVAVVSHSTPGERGRDMRNLRATIRRSARRHLAAQPGSPTTY